ncbi:MAG: C45 family autoproteolytic acyltransferase/hydrolase [Candidatus Hodarchaeota archaeon]
MKKKLQLFKKKYYLTVIKGSSYDVGFSIAKDVDKFPNKRSFIAKNTVKFRKFGFKNFDDFKSSLEMACPGIIEEIQGFCDGLNLNLKRIQFFHTAYDIPQNCSVLTLLPQLTSNNSTLVAYSNEWSYLDPLEDFTFVTSQVDQKYKHFSFMAFGFGRGNGFNEKGLGIFISNGGAFAYPLTTRGFGLAILVRAILEQCANIDQAIDLIKELPVSFPYIFSIVDQGGNAIRIEWLDGRYSIDTIEKNSELQYLCATNHYLNPEMVSYNSYNNSILNSEPFLQNSQTRSNLLEDFIQSHQPNITIKELKELFSQEYPNGPSAHYYQEGFGTMYSLVTDLTNLSLNICFGPPKYNEWVQMYPLELSKAQYFEATFPKL